MKVHLLVLVLGCTSAFAQDPGTFAAQQAQQATDQAMQQAAQANAQAMQQMQQAQQQASTTATTPAVVCTTPPQFSVKAGTVKAGTAVRLKSRTHYAVIYYTTNGWTPTTASRRYDGPIPIDATMQLQAIAIAPSMLRSPIGSAKYSVPGTQPAMQASAISTDGVLRAGTQLQLVTGSNINSKTVEVGDAFPLLLAQDVTVGDRVVLPKGTPVDAVITVADHAGHAGVPGDVAFEVHSITVGGKQITLKGGESLQGADHYGRAMGFLFVPVVGLAGLAAHGDEAQIKAGMTVTAAVDVDTSLQP
jgi:type II secretory pathway pseudopilin PulG